MCNYLDRLNKIDMLIEKHYTMLNLLNELKSSVLHEEQYSMTELSVSINFSRDDLKKFKCMYNIAVEKNLESFMYKNKEFLTGYAKYVIEYLENVIQK